MDEDGAAAAIALISEERYLPPMMGMPREVKIRAAMAILPACSRMVVKCEGLRPCLPGEMRDKTSGQECTKRWYVCSAITDNATTARRNGDFSPPKPTTRIQLSLFQ